VYHQEAEAAVKESLKDNPNHPSLGWLFGTEASQTTEDAATSI